jgi:hypothetical protein
MNGENTMTREVLPAPCTNPDETASLARELAAAYRQMVAFYHHQLELSLPDADRRARGRDDTPEQMAEDTAHIRARPPDQVSWFDLNRLADRDPEAMLDVWTHIKEQGRQELDSGHRTAQALDWEGRPWSRARFLAIRNNFRASTPPQNGIESALLDTAAEAFGDYLEWSEHHHMQVSTEVETERDALERNGGWSPPRLGMAEAIEQSSRMRERAHARFLKTVKMLHELQRSTPTLYVANAGQINVGQQQVNLAGPPETREEQEFLPKSSAQDEPETE